jgi:hypothetical protein
VLFNLLYLLLGSLVRFTGLGSDGRLSGARVIFGGLLLWAVAVLIRETLPSPAARKIAFALVCVGSGFGWIWQLESPEQGPVDLWQPEAITFLSLYFTPLFIAALALMVVFLVPPCDGNGGRASSRSGPPWCPGRFSATSTRMM